MKPGAPCRGVLAVVRPGAVKDNRRASSARCSASACCQYVLCRIFSSCRRLRSSSSAALRPLSRPVTAVDKLVAAWWTPTATAVAMAATRSAGEGPREFRVFGGWQSLRSGELLREGRGGCPGPAWLPRPSEALGDVYRMPRWMFSIFVGVASTQLYGSKINFYEKTSSSFSTE